MHVTINSCRTLTMVLCLSLLGCRGGKFKGDPGNELEEGESLEVISSVVHTKRIKVDLSKPDPLPDLHVVWVVENSKDLATKRDAIHRSLGVFRDATMDFSDNTQLWIITDKKKRAYSKNMFVRAWDGIKQQERFNHGLEEARLIEASFQPIWHEAGPMQQLHTLAYYLAPSKAADYGFLINNKESIGNDQKLSANFFGNQKALKAMVVMTASGEHDTGDSSASEAFLKLLSDHSPSGLSRFRFYGIFNEGLAKSKNYEKLASSLGGTSFPIYEDAKWDSFMQSTTNSIKSALALQSFAFDQDMAKVETIKVDGAAISSKDYFIADGKIFVTKNVLAEGQILTIRYQKNDAS